MATAAPSRPKRVLRGETDVRVLRGQVTALTQQVAALQAQLAQMEEMDIIIAGSANDWQLLSVADHSPRGEQISQQIVEQLQALDPYLPRHMSWRRFAPVQVNLPKALQNSATLQSGAGLSVAPSSA